MKMRWIVRTLERWLIVRDDAGQPNVEVLELRWKSYSEVRNEMRTRVGTNRRVTLTNRLFLCMTAFVGCAQLRAITVRGCTTTMSVRRQRKAD